MKTNLQTIFNDVFVTTLSAFTETEIIKLKIFCLELITVYDDVAILTPPSHKEFAENIFSDIVLRSFVIKFYQNLGFSFIDEDISLSDFVKTTANNMSFLFTQPDSKYNIVMDEYTQRIDSISYKRLFEINPWLIVVFLIKRYLPPSSLT